MVLRILEYITVPKKIIVIGWQRILKRSLDVIFGILGYGCGITLFLDSKKIVHGRVGKFG